MLGLIVVGSYITASARNPGTLTHDTKRDGFTFLDLLTKFNPTELCPDCKVIRTPRSRHCAICNVCVERFDHHCPWINNCVGVRNHGPFLLFLLSTWVLCVAAMAFTVEMMVEGVADPEMLDLLPLGDACFFNTCTKPGVFYTAGAIVLVITFFFTFPISLLLYVHVKNFSVGKTTNERFARKAGSNSFSEAES